MAQAQPILPRKINTDIAAELLQDGTVRLIKNLTLKKGANGIGLGRNEDKLKPLQSNEIYASITLPDGDNYCIGSHYFDITNEIYAWIWNSKGNHLIYRVNCDNRTIDIVKIDPNLNFQLKPEYFIHENGCYLELVDLVDPITGVETKKRDLYWTDGFNYQGYLRVDDCIATDGFNPITYPYFEGNYDPTILIRMGIPTLDDCISIAENPLTQTDIQLSNELLFQTWKFRVSATDVFGRPTEHGIIAYYVPGVNDCISSSGNAPRCITLGIKVDNPFIDSLNIEYLNDNGTVWRTAETVFLYEGDRVNNWWLRSINPNLVFDNTTKILSYIFCADKGKEPIATTDTSRLDNPMPSKSQAMLKLQTRLAFLNNENGFNPLSQDLLKNITTSIEYPQVNNNNDLVSITIYVPIYCPYNGHKTGVRKDGTNGYIWGGNEPRGFLQYFQNTSQSGFVGYLNDGDSVISTQVCIDSNNNLVDDPTHSFPEPVAMQKFVFTNKRKGQYIFRLASHLCDPTVTVNFQSTSTTVLGLFNFNISNGIYNLLTQYNSQELDIDCSSGDYDNITDGRCIVIADNDYIYENLIGHRISTQLNMGYLYETNKNGFNENPIELAVVGVGHGKSCQSTDHNGFYWYGATGTGARYWNINLSYKGAVVNALSLPTNGSGGGYQNDPVIADSLRTTPNYSSFSCNRTIIKGQVILEGTSIGVANATVTLQRGLSATTDSFGFFSLIAHDDIIAMSQNPKQARYDNLVFSSPCIYHDALTGLAIQDINLVIPLFNPPTPFVDSERDLLTWVNADGQTVVIGWDLTFDNFKGLLSGGYYGIGVVTSDWLGRRSFIQDIGYITMPTVAQTGIVAPCKVKVTINPNATFSKDISWFDLFITNELSQSGFIEWIVDKVDFIDNTGAINDASPTQIRIWYSSLNEFNKQNNFSTTTMWQFLVQSTSNPILGDKVQFIINGDGTIFDQSITSIVKYDSVGQYFLIDYSTALKDLKPFGKIRLVRPRNNDAEIQPYYEICGSRVDIVNGKATRNEFYLDIYDTYYLSRQIPVPTSLNNLEETITETTSSQSGGITTTVATAQTQTVAYSNELKSVGFYFEHNAPSNFWGANCWGYGRVNVKNPYEAKNVNYNQIALTGEISSNGLLNYLNYFDTNLQVELQINNTGGLVGGMALQGVLRLIAQNGNYVVGYNDNLLRQNSDGSFSVPSAQNGFGQPERTEDGEYGCKLRDKNTIGIKGNTIVFLDTTNCELIGFSPRGVIHFTKNSHDIIFIDKIKSVQGTNRYFHRGVNPLTDEYLLTDFNIDNPTYINQERQYDVESSETLSFDLNTGDFLGQFSFTGENYVGSSGDILHKNFFSFKEGQIWNHYNISENTSFNTFYNEEVERVLWIVHNAGILDEKTFRWIEVYSRLLYWAFKIETESGQSSRLLKSQWRRSLKFYSAAFLSAINSPNANGSKLSQLFNGNPLYGRYVNIHLVGDNKDNSVYSELAGIVVNSTKIEKSGVR